MKTYEKGKDFRCEGIAKDGKTLCPLKDHCGLYCVGFDKTKTDHFAWAPFKGDKCDKYQERDIDSIIINSLNKN